MNREILFRGKRANNGEWVYGDLRQYVNLVGCEDFYEIDTMSDTIGYGHSYKVIPETVSQFTGLTDRNGNKIFDGDILDDNDGKPSYVCVFDNGRFGFYSIKEYIRGDFSYYDYDFVTSICTIVGNIHDNPELLKA